MDHPEKTVKASNRTKSSDVIRYRDLEPQWHVPGAKEPGFMRWLISWVGGPPGYVNPNKDVAHISEEVVVGMMSMPVGQRQKGLHYHSVAEIYVVVRGELEGYDGKGQVHRAGPMDCVYIPAGVPHGVRNCGTEECELIWVHDGIEKIGTSVYYYDGIVTGPPQVDEISMVRFIDLEPSYAAYRAEEIEFARSMVHWVGGPEGFDNQNKGVAAESEKVAIGLTVIPPGQKSVLHAHDDAEVYVVLKGKGLLSSAHDRQEICKYDGAYIPSCVKHGVRNHGQDPLYLMWIHAKAQKAGSTKYEGEANGTSHG